MGYSSEVAEARRLTKRSEADNWRLAELAHRAVEVHGRSRSAWGRDVGCSSGHASVLYRVWDRWSSGKRPAFWDAYEKVNLGDDSATKGSARADSQVAAASPKALRRALKGERIGAEDKAAILADLASDPAVIRRYREQRAPEVTERDAKAAAALSRALTERVGNAATGLQVPLWLDQLHAIAKELEAWELGEDDVRKLTKAVTRLSDELTVQAFRLGLEVSS